MISESVKAVYAEHYTKVRERLKAHANVEAISADVLSGALMEYLDELIDTAVFSGRITDAEITEAVSDPEWAAWTWSLTGLGDKPDDPHAR